MSSALNTRDQHGRRPVPGRTVMRLHRERPRFSSLFISYVFLSQAAFHSLEDWIRALDAPKDQKGNCLHDVKVEAGIDVCSTYLIMPFRRFEPRLQDKYDGNPATQISTYGATYIIVAHFEN